MRNLRPGVIGCIWACLSALLTIVIVWSAFAETELVYTNPVYGWSIKYPTSWSLDSSDLTSVRIHSPENDSLCGVNSGLVRAKSVEEFTDFMLTHSARTFHRRGLEVVISSRKKVVMLSGIIGVDLLVDLIPVTYALGGRSRRLFVLVDSVGLVLDCETYATNWNKLEPTFDWIMGSFALGEQN